MFIDGIEVPDGPFGPQSNIKLIDGQWVLLPALGRNLSPEYRVIPAKLLKDAALFQDASGSKVGYIDQTALTNYIRSITPPKGPEFAKIKKELDDTVKSFQDAAADIRNPDPEVQRLSEQFTEQYLAPGRTKPTGFGIKPINQDGTVKAIDPRTPTSAKPETTLAGGPIQGPGLKHKKTLIYNFIFFFTHQACPPSWSVSRSRPGHQTSRVTS